MSEFRPGNQNFLILSTYLYYYVCQSQLHWTEYNSWVFIDSWTEKNMFCVAFYGETEE